MIHPFRALWKQFTGSQANALLQGTIAWIKEGIDKNLEYFKNFSIETAVNSHLTLIGFFSGFIRPIVTVANQNFATFTDGLEHDSTYGFSDGYNNPPGGLFSDINDGQYHIRFEYPEDQYREMLEVFCNNESEPLSLDKLDALMYTLWKQYRGDTPLYTFEFLTTETKGFNRSEGDVVINLGSANDWGDGDDDDRTALVTVNGFIHTIGNTIYGPEPRLWPSMTQDGTPLQLEANYNSDVFNIQDGDTLNIEVIE